MPFSPDALYIGAVLALALYSLIKIIETLIKKVITKKEEMSSEHKDCALNIKNSIDKIYKRIEEDSLLTEDERDWLKYLYDLLEKTDKDGIPLCYFPRSYIESQKEMIKVLNNISLWQEKMTYILESLLRNLDKKE